MTKTAFITGITGQDGSYLTELLLDKGYQVHGLVRRASTENTQNIGHLLGHERLVLHVGDLTDASAIEHILKVSRPDEIYNLAAQSHVRVSFDIPVQTCDINSLGPMRILEAMRNLNMIDHSKFYQASTSELYGLVKETPQNEDTPFHPRSPYGVSKLYAYWAVKNYRESYGLKGCNGILFNHESPRRGLNFVTRKITNGVCRMAKGEIDYLELGNLDALRDWGHAQDYVYGMWLMLQQDEPKDYVLATGEYHSVRDFVEISSKYIGWDITWEGAGVDEVGRDQTGQVRFKINPEFYRPAEVDLLLGDPTKAKKELGWERKHTFDSMVQDMIEHDLQ